MMLTNDDIQDDYSVFFKKENSENVSTEVSVTYLLVDFCLVTVKNNYTSSKI